MAESRGLVYAVAVTAGVAFILAGSYQLYVALVPLKNGSVSGTPLGVLVGFLQIGGGIAWLYVVHHTDYHLSFSGDGNQHSR